VTERVYVLPPASQLGPISHEQRQALISSSLVAGVYEKTLDRASAYEKIKGQASQPVAPQTTPQAGQAQPAPAAGGGFLDSIGDLFGSGVRRSRASVGEQLVKSAASAIGREVGRQIIRGVLGSILGGGRR
jgi:hypothetical protein